MKTKKTVCSKRHELFEREVAIHLEPVGVEGEGFTPPARMVTSEFDWWSKYYTSLPDHPLKHAEYENGGMDTLKVCEGCVCQGEGVCEGEGVCVWSVRVCVWSVRVCEGCVDLEGWTL